MNVSFAVENPDVRTIHRRYISARQYTPRGALTERIRVSAWLLALMPLFLLAPTALAQDNGDLRLGKRVYQERGQCSFCHGWAGNGEGDPFAPLGANLRETELTREQVFEVVQCGRPDTEMPHFDRLAYSDGRCFGLTAADLGDSKPRRAPQTLREAEIEAVSDYLFARVVGRGEITLAECEEFFSPGSRQCVSYK